MKNIILTLIITLSLNAFAQVGINTTNPDPSSILDVESTTSGFLPPRMTEIQMNDIDSPAEGLILYCTDCVPKGVRVFDGTHWSNLLDTVIYTSTSQLDALGYPAGEYTFNFPGTGLQVLFYQDNLETGVGYVRVFSSLYGGNATVNHVDKDIPFTKFLVQRNDGAHKQSAYFNTSRLFNTSLESTVSNGGTRTGYKVFIGYAGGHGIYNTSQAQCSWTNSGGSVGAGFNGTDCGSYPNALFWGTGNSGTGVYSNRNGTWEIWIAN
jgi:hypothetical protein